MSEKSLQLQVAKIFLRAADYIRKYGWQEEGMGEDGQPRCSMGALQAAYPKVQWDKRLANFMYRALNKELNGLSLTQFNHKFQNGEMVARLYERVAKKVAA